MKPLQILNGARLWHAVVAARLTRVRWLQNLKPNAFDQP